jgi:GxxExxY protein
MNLNDVTKTIVGAAIEVRRILGPGLLESVYESALCLELDALGLANQRQLLLPVSYKSRVIGEYRLDLLVEDSVIGEIKSVERYDPVFAAQVLTKLRVTGKILGLLINFNTHPLMSGIRRFVLGSAPCL